MAILQAYIMIGVCVGTPTRIPECFYVNDSQFVLQGRAVRSDYGLASQMEPLIYSLHCVGEEILTGLWNRQFWEKDRHVCVQTYRLSQAVWGLLTFRDTLGLGNKAVPLKTETSSQREPEAHPTAPDKSSTDF